MLQRSGGQVLWRAIAEALETQIRDGELSPGAQLPTENELAARFGVNRHTVRRALGDMQSRGLVDVTQGRGSFVRRPMVAIDMALADPCAANGADAVHETVIDVQSEPADVDAARALGCERGAPLSVITTQVSVGGELVALRDNKILRDAYPGLIDAVKDGARMADALASAGATVAGHTSAEMRARAASVSEVAALALPRHAPIIVVETVLLDGDDKPLSLSFARCAGDRVAVTCSSSCRDAPEALKVA